VLVEILKGNARYIERARQHVDPAQAVPVIVIEEIYRGRLSAIRRAESGQGAVGIVRAYELFERTHRDFLGRRVLAYDEAAHQQYLQWKGAKIKVATHDLRIAAICVAKDALLVSRNRRDFERVPSLRVEYWA
jgi:tRNA(fMet)-specific endonuclease VapC